MEQEKPTTITVGTETSYWEQILNQVYSADEKGTNGSKKSLIEARKRVVVLGDRGSGKSSLFRRSISAAAEQAIPKGYGAPSGASLSAERGCGFSYNLGYFGGFRGDEELDNFFGEGGDYDVNEDDDDSAFAGVFEIGSLEQAPTLLAHAVPSEAVFKNSIFVFVVNPVCSARRGCTPALASLAAWADVVRKFAVEKGYTQRNSGMDVSLDAIRQNRAINTFAQFARVQNYIFSRAVSQTSPSNSPSKASQDSNVGIGSGDNVGIGSGSGSGSGGAPGEATMEELASLSEVLCDNIGAPVVVSLSKVDSDAMLPQKGGLVVGGGEQESTFEFLGVVQDYLRAQCLSLGAGLVFNSERKNRNIDVLYAYIGYLLFGFKVGFRPQANAADSVFIPAGWDTKSKIAFEFEAKKIPADEPFAAVVRERFNKEAGGSDAEAAKGTPDGAVEGEDVLDSRAQSDQEFLRLLKNKLESTPVYGDDGSVEYAVPSSSPIATGSAPAVSPTLTTTLNFRSLRRKDTAAAAAPPSSSPQQNTTE